MISEIEKADLYIRLMVEIGRKGSTRETIAALYREGIIVGGESFGWPRINAAILDRYTVSGLDYIKKLAWGYGAVGRRAEATSATTEQSDSDHRER